MNHGWLSPLWECSALLFLVPLLLASLCFDLLRFAVAVRLTCPYWVLLVTNVVSSVEFVVRAALHDSVEDDFVHSIAGRIIAEPGNRGEEHAGEIRASLVQFGGALDHGISSETVGDGISGDISEYWEYLFDAETGYLKEEIQNEFEVASTRPNRT